MRETHSKHPRDGRASPRKGGIGRSKVASVIIEKGGESNFLHGIFLTEPVRMIEKDQKLKMFGKWYLVDR